MKPRRLLRWTLAAAALAYLAIAAGMALLQDRFIYRPDPAPLEQLVNETLRPWPSAEAFRGLVAEPAGPARATAIVFHGNAGHAGHRQAYAAALVPLGVRVILAEYPGYGPRPGPVGEASYVPDAAETIALAHRRYGGPLVVIGESLGAGVAAAAAARERELIAGVLMLTPWDRLEHVAAGYYPWLPVRWLLRDRYDSAAHLARFGRPVMVLVAGEDRVVPERLGLALYESLAEPRKLTRLPDAGHNGWLRQVDDAWWRQAVAFLLGDAASGRPSP